MHKIFNLLTKVLIIFILFSFNTFKVNADDIGSILLQLKNLQEDIKTLERAVYSQDVKSTTTQDISNSGNDIFTKHLLKLSELEEQFTKYDHAS